MASKPKRPAQCPDGSTERPAYGLLSLLGGMPAPKEDGRLAVNLDWPWIRLAVNSGEVVEIAVTEADNGALIDALQGYLSFDLVIRLHHDALWICRPWALGRMKAEG